MDRSALRSAGAHVLVDADVLDIDGVVPLEPDVEHHLQRVLRLRPGETVGLTDGAGRWRLAVVAGTDSSAPSASSTFAVETTSPVRVEPRRSEPLTIATAIPKGDRLDWLVQKVTELGVDRLLLLDAERSATRWTPDRAGKQLARCRRIADEALRQSRRIRRLEIDGPVPASTVLADFVVTEPGGRALAGGDRRIAVGPEGGWTPAELELARDRVDLGDTILRTETASVAAATLCVAFDRSRSMM